MLIRSLILAVSLFIGAFSFADSKPSTENFLSLSQEEQTKIFDEIQKEIKTIKVELARADKQYDSKRKIYRILDLSESFGILGSFASLLAGGSLSAKKPWGIATLSLAGVGVLGHAARKSYQGSLEITEEQKEELEAKIENLENQIFSYRFALILNKSKKDKETPEK